MSKLHWYWHRLRAMSPAEMALHARKKWRQFTDDRKLPDWAKPVVGAGEGFPKLPLPATAPAALREALADDARRILGGRWLAFGHLELAVDDPPHWHKDYLAGCEIATDQSAFRLNHRVLPQGADSKLIWELSRWHELVRLAMAAHVLDDQTAADKCVDWLEDWVRHNRPYRGWNWTSALEAGIRLIQFAWLDALIAGRVEANRWTRLRQAILPAHVWFTWRHQSFGTSANNHLLGELVGLIVVTARWPALARWGAKLDDLQPRWEREVLAQFAPDGGNREQALNYQLFSFEFAWQARLALKAAHREISSAVESRLRRAIRFFHEVQAAFEPWDYGDSDSAFVSPIFIHASGLIREWRDWAAEATRPCGVCYWLDAPPTQDLPLGRGRPLETREIAGWWHYPESGIALHESGFWWTRWDLSPLGYLKMAAHGHLDALHLSVWYKGVAIIIDPGTGAYYVDPELRDWLSSRAAHNGPSSSYDEWPRRMGPFLWSEHHPEPRIAPVGKSAVLGTIHFPRTMLSREIHFPENGLGFSVEDSVAVRGAADSFPDFTVCWQFAPGTRFKWINERTFVMKRREMAVTIEISADWTGIELVEEAPRKDDSSGRLLEGVVSSAFRKVEWAPYLKLTARPRADKPCVFKTTFLASPLS